MFRWGIIGTGGIARAFADDITNLRDHKVCAVLSRNIETAKQFSHSINDCLDYDNQQAFLNDDNIDAVYVATPNNLHCNQTIFPPLKIKTNITNKVTMSQHQECQRKEMLHGRNFIL